MTNLTDELADTRRIRENFEDLIANPERLGPDYEPVHRLEDDAVIGWQAVGRGVDQGGQVDRATFMRTAIALGLAERLDWAFRCRVLEQAIAAGFTEPVHLKPSYVAYGTVAPPRLAVAFSRARAQVPVVAEVHESAWDDPKALATGLEEFRRWGWDVAVGDVSARTDAGTLLQKVRPKYAAVDLSSPGRSTSDVVKRYVETAQRLGVEVLATGVDSPLRKGEAQTLGVTCARGRAIGEPVAAPAD